MANKKASIKDIQVNKRNHQRNQNYLSRMKTYIKKTLAAISNKKAEDKEKTVQETLKMIDKIAAKGIIHKKTAARKKSRLSKALNTTKK